MTSKTLKQPWAFEAENFPYITLREDLSETWNELGLSSLIPAEQQGLKRLLDSSGISQQSDYNRNNVLLVKAEGGVPKQVYGPAIFRAGNEIVLKVGSNQAIVIQEGERLVVGDLKGKIAVASQEDSAGNEYPTATVNFVSPDKDVFKVRVALAHQNEPIEVGELEATLINEESILPYLAQVPSPVLKMQELGIGEFEVKAISSSDGEYGKSYKLHLADGQVVWARGNSQMLLKEGYQMQPSTPLTLRVTAIEEYAPGKFKVDNALRERLPRLEGVRTPAAMKTLEAQVSEVQVQEQQEEEEDLDSIPF
jgi:hypothetical protein